MGRELTLTAALLALLALWSGAGAAGQWVNPREVIQDAGLARLQQGRKELTPMEREELEKYGVTGLEAMTYLDDNEDPGGQDYEAVERLIQLTFGKHLSVEEWINKKKYYFADHQALLARDGIRPGDVENKRIVVEIYPPAVRGMGVLVHQYLKGEDFPLAEDVWVWEPRLRRIRRYPEARRDDNCFGTEMTWDDYSFREPWEEVKGHFYHFTDALLHDDFNPSFDRKPSRSQNFGKVKNWLQLKYKYHLTDHEVLWGELAMLYAALYALSPTHTDRRPDAQHDSAWWRSHKRWFKEFFLESQRGPWALRLGKQQVVWGKTDLFRILDKVNPQDQREIISDQMEGDFTRRATWMFNVEYGFSPHASLQLLWIPDFEPDLFAPVGSLNSPFTLFPLPAFLALQKTDRPEDWGDGEYGVRLNFQNVQGSP